jgi:hypothetical protein
MRRRIHTHAHAPSVKVIDVYGVQDRYAVDEFSLLCVCVRARVRACMRIYTTGAPKQRLARDAIRTSPGACVCILLLI